jgi:hypothetical protein
VALLQAIMEWLYMGGQQQWDELEPERRQSLIQSLKELASESKEVYDGTEQAEH